jgi:lipoprotein-releasing system ATP-binding protein
VTGLTRQFAGADGPLDVLRGVDFEMQRGEAIAITGPSGSGKSTLLYILGALDRPTSGEFNIQGLLPLRLSPAAQSEYRNSQVGFVFQDHHLLPQCTVLENVLIPTLPRRREFREADQRARDLLDRVGLRGRLQHRPAQLSGGERQRVAVCRALINRPLLLLADEPTGNLDQRTAESVGSLLLDVAAEQQAMLICVTHSLELAARFSRRYELRAGLLADGQTTGAS